MPKEPTRKEIFDELRKDGCCWLGGQGCECFSRQLCVCFDEKKREMTRASAPAKTPEEIAADIEHNKKVCAEIDAAIAVAFGEGGEN